MLNFIVVEQQNNRVVEHLKNCTIALLFFIVSVIVIFALTYRKILCENDKQQMLK